MSLQFLWCARCRTAFTFTGAGVDQAAGATLAVRQLDCGALNEIVVAGETEEGDDFYRVVGEVEPTH